MSEQPGLSHAIRAALLTGEAGAKVFAARQVARHWRLGRLRFDLGEAEAAPMPDRPEWPDRLELLPPSQMP